MPSFFSLFSELFPISYSFHPLFSITFFWNLSSLPIQSFLSNRLNCLHFLILTTHAFAVRLPSSHLCWNLCPNGHWPVPSRKITCRPLFHSHWPFPSPGSVASSSLLYGDRVFSKLLWQYYFPDPFLIVSAPSLFLLAPLPLFVLQI